MAIVQISKIIHRIGVQTDIPQLDIGEVGFSVDTRQLFIGNDYELHPEPDVYGRYHTEILTDQSSIDFSRLNGSNSASMNLTNPTPGQVLALANIDGITTVVNAGNGTTNQVNLGDVQYLKISGSSFNGAILQTDGAGNLTWTTNGKMMFDIANISKSNPANVTTKTPHFFNTGAQVTLYNFAPNGTGMVELLSQGVPAGSCQFWVARTGPYNFTLYESPALDLPNALDSTSYTASVPNTGFSFGGVPQSGNATPGGANTNIQFNDAGGLMGSSNLKFDKATNNLTIAGNIVVNTGKVYGNVQGTVTGDHNGRVGYTTPNTGSFTTVTVSGNVSTSASLVTNNTYLKYGANAWHMFANANGIFFTDSGSGNTYQVNLTQV